MRYSLKTLGFTVTIACLLLVVFLQQRKMDALQRSYNWRSEIAAVEATAASWWKDRALEITREVRGEDGVAALESLDGVNRPSPPADLVTPGELW